MSTQWRITGEPIRRRPVAWVVAGLFVVLAQALGAAEGDPFLKARQGRLSHEVHRLAVAAERGTSLAGARNLDPATRRATVVIELGSEADAGAVAAEVAAAGGSVLGRSGALLKASVPMERLRRVSEAPGVERVRAPFRPSAKAVTSQGVSVIRADAYVATRGANGSGVAVGVLDASFQGVEALLGEELPADLQGTQRVIDGLSSFEDPHGTACAEIVHDTAPGAQLVLASFEDEVSWAAAIDELVASGVRIISHSVGFDNLFPPDGNHFFAQKVDQAAAAGVLFVTAAGNEGGNYFQGAWSDGNANGFLEFGPGAELLPFDGGRVVLRWDDPFGASGHDYDLLVVTAEFASNPVLSPDNPAIVAFSADAQQGADDPREIVDIPEGETRPLYVVVVHDPASGPPPPGQRFWLWAAAGVDPRFASAASTLSLPGDARGAVTVGAVAFDSLAVEGYSSRGPTADGRPKPDVAAPDRVQTASMGASFPGTSAATPHAAGAAALLLSRNPGLDLAGLCAALERTTVRGGAARDNDTGYGLIDLSRAQ